MRAAALASLPLLVLAAAPAHAEAAEGWHPVEPAAVDRLEALVWFVVGPVALFVLIAFLALVPALIKREPILPRHGDEEAQWIGGPGKGAKELPSAEQTAGTGGASGSW